jgi:ankyrin repeat protein
MPPKLTAEDVLKRYMEERLPEFLGERLLDVNQKGRYGNTPLDVAATRGSMEEVIALLDGGADPNLTCEKGVTPLHDAVGQNHPHIVRLLLARGASPDVRADFGGTPREWAVRRSLKDIIDIIDQHLRRAH